MLNALARYTHPSAISLLFAFDYARATKPERDTAKKSGLVSSPTHSLPHLSSSHPHSLISLPHSLISLLPPSPPSPLQILPASS